MTLVRSGPGGAGEHRGRARSRSGHNGGVVSRSKDHLVGRETELGIGRELIRTSWAGVPAMLMIEGAAGIGKSELVRAYTDELIMTGASVFCGTAHAFDRNRPFVALVDALALRPQSADPVRAAVGQAITGAIDLACQPDRRTSECRLPSDHWDRLPRTRNVRP